MRIMIALLIALGGIWLFLDSRDTKPSTPKDGPTAITAQPLVLDASRPSRTQLGKLHFLGAWELKGPDGSFGGLSALAVRPDATIWALNDSGVLFTFPQPGDAGMGSAIKLRSPKPRKKWMESLSDSEALAVAPDFTSLWVGYELANSICRYSADLRVTGQCRYWPEMEDWTPTKSIESLARLPDGRFLAIAEEAGGGKRACEALLFAGDPVDPRTPPPVRMRYVPPPGYSPTDAVWVGEGEMLVLNRRATMSDGFTAMITLVDIGKMQRGAILHGQVVARLAPPVLSDNFEGMALEQRDGQRIVWLVSDDNHLFFQRTLLLKFALPARF